jgi:hypothetical protein
VRCERATLTYDSFDARGIGDLVTARRGGLLTRRRSPMRLRHRLRSCDPSIDPERIAFLGFSFGGEVAHDAAFLNVFAPSWVSAASDSPSCRLLPGRGVRGLPLQMSTPARSLMMIGGEGGIATLLRTSIGSSS